MIILRKSYKLGQKILNNFMIWNILSQAFFQIFLFLFLLLLFYFMSWRFDFNVQSTSNLDILNGMIKFVVFLIF